MRRARSCSRSCRANVHGCHCLPLIPIISITPRAMSPPPFPARATSHSFALSSPPPEKVAGFRLSRPAWFGMSGLKQRLQNQRSLDWMYVNWFELTQQWLATLPTSGFGAGDGKYGESPEDSRVLVLRTQPSPLSGDVPPKFPDTRFRCGVYKPARYSLLPFAS